MRYPSEFLTELREKLPNQNAIIEKAEGGSEEIGRMLLKLTRWQPSPNDLVEVLEAIQSRTANLYGSERRKIAQRLMFEARQKIAAREMLEKWFDFIRSQRNEKDEAET